ncbi:hypothetical protein OH492_08060 [Vibrio chagasii]|nr:hypothetical protein [Vibrio chagasii]
MAHQQLDIDKTHSDICQLQSEAPLFPSNLALALEKSIADNQNELITLMSGAMRQIQWKKSITTPYHYANGVVQIICKVLLKTAYMLEKG